MKSGQDGVYTRCSFRYGLPAYLSGWNHPGWQRSWIENDTPFASLHVGIFENGTAEAHLDLFNPILHQWRAALSGYQVSRVWFLQPQTAPAPPQMGRTDACASYTDLGELLSPYARPRTLVFLRSGHRKFATGRHNCASHADQQCHFGAGKTVIRGHPDWEYRPMRLAVEMWSYWARQEGRSQAE